MDPPAPELSQALVRRASAAPSRSQLSRGRSTPLAATAGRLATVLRRWLHVAFALLLMGPPVPVLPRALP
eukprot:4703362-Alexandrium_andersonii.AAC.1